MGDTSTLEDVQSLLKAHHLPFEDLTTSRVEFIRHYASNNQLIGCIGLEVYDEYGLLRSFAVHQAYHHQGTGGKLLRELFVKSEKLGIKQLHLLTTTADRYFLRFGFDVADRQNAPSVITHTTEFSELCPSSSVYMVKEIR